MVIFLLPLDNSQVPYVSSENVPVGNVRSCVQISQSLSCLLKNLNISHSFTKSLTISQFIGTDIINEGLREVYIFSSSRREFGNPFLPMKPPFRKDSAKGEICLVFLNKRMIGYNFTQKGLIEREYFFFK